MPGKKNQGTSIDCPKGKWTNIAQGSLVGIGAKFRLQADPVVKFKWRWIGSFIPYYYDGTSNSAGHATATASMSAYWRIDVRPSSNTTIHVD